jgi:hypothetical protein
MLVTASGRRRSAISLAWRVSARSGFVIERETSHVSTTAAPNVATAIRM